MRYLEKSITRYNWKTICCCVRSRKGSTSIRTTSGGKNDYAAVSTDSSMFSLQSDLDDIVSKGVVDEMDSSNNVRGGFSHFVHEFGLNGSEEKNGYRTVLSYDDDEYEEENKNDVDKVEEELEEKAPPPPRITIGESGDGEDDTSLSSPKSSEILRRKHDQQGFKRNADETKEDRTSSALTLEDVVSHRERLIQFYEKHNPSRLFNVDYLLEKYRGRESELFSELEKKYSGPQSRPKMTSLTLGGVVDREDTVSNSSSSSSTGGEQQQQRRSTMTLFSIGGGEDCGSSSSADDENDDDGVVTETSGRI